MAIESLLIANRGEIARRIQRTCRTLGIRTIAVYSDADADLPFVREADVAVRLGPAAAADSYLSVEAVLEAARRAGADAVHPGYGFLSENAGFARAVMEAGLTWVGPSPASIEAMGDKARARRLVSAAGVPVVPGYDEDAQDDATLTAAAADIGVPLLVKASAGGGGRGMRRVDDLADLPEALASARREAAGAFGDDRLLLERYVLRPRHVEVQVLGDQHGVVVHLGERDCSVQRRHQKIVEESPAPGLSEASRERLYEAAVQAARAVSYEGAGTVEFVVGADGEAWFLEMNTRLQVEHPVTELVTDLDLIQLQLAVAEGRSLADCMALLVSEDDATDAVAHAAVGVGEGAGGHAFEARVYAEDPLAGWMPMSGRPVRIHLPQADHVRVDGGYDTGDTVSPHYDSMIAKIIAWGATRDQALRRIRRAVDTAWVPGVATNLSLLRDLFRDDAFVAGDVHTGLLTERGLPVAPPTNLARGARLATAWTWWLRQRGREGVAAPTAWRLGGSAEQTDRWSYGAEVVEVGWRAASTGLIVRVDEEEPVEVRVLSVEGDLVWVEEAGVRSRVRIASHHGDELDEGGTVYLHLGSGEAMVTRVPRFAPPLGVAEAPGSCTAPTPGVVRALHVAVGEAVDAGAPLVTLEAMKMEHVVTAPEAGVVEAVLVSVGQSVDGGALLVRLAEPGAPA